MHVISASRRTDIPAFHAEWFMNRLRAGFVRVAAPFGGGEYEVSLAAGDVLCIVFWTKNAGPIAPHLTEISRMGYCSTFLYTINNYPTSLEPRVPGLDHTLDQLRRIGKILPRQWLRWRYDTIVLTERLNSAWHLRNFDRLCARLAPYTNECIFSFCDYYNKTIRNMQRNAADYRRPVESECMEIAEQMAEIAGCQGIALASCSHDFLVSERIQKARCIDPEFLASVVDSTTRLEAVKKLKIAPTRKECGCASSRDIGAYNTCNHGCVYCYANASPEAAAKRMAMTTTDAVSLTPRSP